MERQEIIGLLVEELVNDNNNMQLVGNAVAELMENGEQLELFNLLDRAEVPRNHNFYEETIPQYMGDLFIEHFRMSRECAEVITQQIGNLGVIPIGAKIPLEKKVLFTIWVLAKPESFLACGDRFNFAKSTAHNVFKEIVSAVLLLMPQYIMWPNNHNDTIMAFHEKSRGIPGVVGVVDGCHIPIKQPPFNAVDYFNRKQFHSIILQGICNNKKIYLDIFVGMPGRVHDARVFQTSPIFQHLNDDLNPLLEQDHHIIGDSAYPLMRNVLTPFRDNGHLNEDIIRYNTRLSSIRSTIERSFGLLKGKFRRLKYLDIGNPEFGIEIISACCILHNAILINMGNNDEDEEIEINDENNEFPIENENRNRQIGVLKREHIVELLRNF